MGLLISFAGCKHEGWGLGLYCIYKIDGKSRVFAYSLLQLL